MRARLTQLVIIGIPVLVGVVLAIREVRVKRRKARRRDEMSADAVG